MLTNHFPEKKWLFGAQYFVQDKEGSTVTVNGKRYLKMLKCYYIPALKKRNEEGVITFQLDGAPPHIANDVLHFLQATFGERPISRNCDFFWPPYSPDLNPCDFFLWGYLKGRVFSDPIPETIGDLKRNIKREIKKIPEDTLQKIRLKKVRSRKGGWIEHIISK